MDISTRCRYSHRRINFCAAHRNFSQANWRKRNKARALFKGEAVTASCWRWRNAVISVIPHFSLRPPSSTPPACRFVLSKLLAAMLKSVPSPFSTSSPFSFCFFFLFIPSLSRVDCIRLCAVSSTFFACSPTVIGQKGGKKNGVRAGLHLSSRGARSQK